MIANAMQFDKEEQQILQDFENGEFRRIRNFEAEKKEGLPQNLWVASPVHV